MTQNRPSLFKLITVSSIGSALEFYDFAIYAFFSHEISLAFFPSSSAITSLITTFGVFAVGYLVRPIGGLIFSHLGDKFGRKNNFSLSILIMATSTMLMGLTPSYHYFGESAAVIFFTLRLFQGLSLGAETPGALTYIAESVKSRQGFWCSIVFALMNLGAVLAILIHVVLNHFLTAHQLAVWGWRVPFILGGFLGFFGWIIRRSMSESFAFLQQQWKADVPLLALFRFYPTKLLAAILIAMLGGTSVSLIYLYMPSYLQTLLHYHYNIINLNISLSLILFTIMIIFFGYLSDKFSRKKMIAVGATLLLIFAFPGYRLIYLAHHSMLPYVFGFFAIITGMIMGSIPALFTRLFVTQVRYTGVALSYNVGIAITAGLAPMIVTIFIKYTNPVVAPAVMLMVTSVIALIGVALIPKGFLETTLHTSSLTKE